MTITIENSSSPLTESILVEQKLAWKFTLPESYRAFLLQFNGGIARPNKFLLGNSDTSNLERFFSLREIIESESYSYAPAGQVSAKHLSGNEIPKNRFTKWLSGDSDT